MRVRTPIVSCAQCPGCRNFFPVPPSLLAELTVPPLVPTSLPVVSTISSTFATEPNRPVSILSRNETYTPIQTRNTPSSALKSQRSYSGHTNAPVSSPSDYETSWQSKFYKIPVLIIGILELVSSIVIIGLEIVSLIISVYLATGAGLWCGIDFFFTGIFTIVLATRWKRVRLRATIMLGAQIAVLVFSCVLVGIVGSFLTATSSIYTLNNAIKLNSILTGINFSTKYKLMQAQLAFGILTMFTAIAYIIFYMVTTYRALWKPFHTLDTPHLFHASSTAIPALI